MLSRSCTRLLSLLTLAFAVAVGVLSGPAHAEVYDRCVVERCWDVREALAYWQDEGLPAKWVTNVLPGEQCYTGGGTFGNREGQLPQREKGAYREFDVYPRPCGQGRDAHRIVVDHEDGDTWYTDDHYRNFHLL